MMNDKGRSRSGLLLQLNPVAKLEDVIGRLSEHDALDLLLVESLSLQESRGKDMELVFLGPQQTADPIVRAAQKVPDLRVGLLVEGFAPLFRGRECYGSNFIAHTTVFDHMPCLVKQKCERDAPKPTSEGQLRR